MNFNFGEVLSRAWQIIWKHKVLWIFGILASCSQGGRGYNSGGNGGRGTGGPGPGNLPPQLERFFEMIAQNAVPILITAVSLVCIFWLIAIFLGTIGRIGLIRGTWQVEGGTERLIFGQLFSESTPYFWRVFGLSLIPAIPVLISIVLFFIGLAIFATTMQAGRAQVLGALGFIPVIIACVCILVPVLWVVGLIFRQAERVIVLEGLPVLPSISRGWEIFRSHLGEIILMAIILGILAVVAGFIIAIPVFIVVVPAAIAFAASNTQNWTPLIAAGGLLCLYIPISLLLNGIVISFTESAWTLTYLRLTRKPDANELVTPDPETPPPPSLDDGDKTVISSSHA